MSKNLNQARLAELARDSAVQRKLEHGNQITSYWYYPAKNKLSQTKSLVMIHGYRGNHHGLEAIAGALQNVDIYIPDLPGFGQSSPLAAEHTIANYSVWLEEFIRALKLRNQPHLLGHSFGSIVVSAFASKQSGIASLILENPIASPALKGPKAAVTAVAKSFFWLAGALPQAAGDWILKSWPMVRGMSIIMTKSRTAELRRWVHRQHDENFNDYANRRVALEGYNASISSCVADYVESFRVPTLMLVGEKDDITTVAQQNQLFASIPVADKKISVFPKVGHLTHYEIPDQIASAIEEWVDEHE